MSAVAIEARDIGTEEVIMGNEVITEAALGEEAGLGMAVHAFVNFKQDVILVHIFMEVDPGRLEARTSTEW